MIPYTDSPEESEDSQGAGPERAWPFLLLGLLLFGVGVAAWRPIPVGVWHDDGVYMLIGKALAEGRGLVYAGVVDAPPAAKFPPLYPLFLAALWSISDSIGVVTMAATFLNLALLAGAGALFARALAHGTGLGVRGGLAVGALAFASTDVMRTALIPLSESLFLVLVAGALVLWPRVERRDPRALVAVTLLLLAVVATRTAGLAVVLAYGTALGLRRRFGAMVGVTAPAIVFAAGWSWWSGRASATIPAEARDLLGPYGGWIVEQTFGAPTTFLANLPAHALGVVERTVAMTFPGVVGWPIWVLGVALTPLAALGLYHLTRRFPPMGWFGVIYLGVLLVWPYLDRRLLVPWFPVLLASVALGALRLVGSARPGTAGEGRPSPVRRVAWGLVVVWVVAYASVTAGRIADGWPTEAYRLRANRLAASVEALSRTVPSDAVVGAPEYWAALHLHGGWTVAPSVRFDPRRTGPDEPMWGTPAEQLSLWRQMEIDHLLLEQNGVMHQAALDRIEESCPGSVFVLARMPSSMVVRIEWDEACAIG